jgi:hypothetical protein
MLYLHKQTKDASLVIPGQIDSDVLRDIFCHQRQDVHIDCESQYEMRVISA